MRERVLAGCTPEGDLDPDDQANGRDDGGTAGGGIDDYDPDASDNHCENIQLRDVLDDAGYTFDLDLWHWHEPDAAHNDAAWAERVWRPLEIFAPL